MSASVVQNIEGAQNTGLATVTVNHSAAVAGSLLLLVVGSDDYRTTAGGSRPESSGYALMTGTSQETFLGHYVWMDVATGGETSVQYTIGSAATSCWEWYEVAGLDASPYDTSNGQFLQSSAASYTTPAITPTAGERWLFASMGASSSLGAFTGVDTWLNSFTELNDTFTTLGSGTRDLVSGAERSVTADGVATFSSGASYTGATPQSRTGIIISFKVAGDAAPFGYFIQPMQRPGPGPWGAERFRQDPRSTTDGDTGPAATELDLTPAGATWSAEPMGAVEPQPVQLTLTPATSSWSAVSVTPSPGQVAVTLTPAGSSWSALPVAAAPIVALTPTTATWTAVPVVSTPAVPLTHATASWTAVAVTPTPQPVQLTLTPATATWAAVPVVVLAQASLTPATATWTAVAVTPVPQPVNVTITPATATWTAQQVALQTPGAMTALPATTTWTAVPVTPTPQPVARTLTPAVATWTAVAVVPIPAVSLLPATATWAARPLSLAIGQVARTLVPAELTWLAVPLGIELAGEPGVVHGRAVHAGRASGRAAGAAGGSATVGARISESTRRAGEVDGNVV